MNAPRTSQLRQCGRVKIRWKRIGCLRSVISRPPVTARKASASAGAAQRTAAFPQARTPAKASATGTAKLPAAIDLVQVYRLTRQPQGAWWGTS